MEHECRFEGARRHFAMRARERIGPHVDGEALWWECYRALLEDREDICRFKARRASNAAYRINVDGVEWFIIVARSNRVPLTVIPRQDQIYDPDTFDRRVKRGRRVRSKFKRHGPSDAWRRRREL